MSEDSWSTSDTPSGDTSSSNSTSDGSSGGWGDAAGEVVGRLLGDLLEPGTNTASTASGPSSTGVPLLNPTIQALFLAGDGQPVVESRSYVRQLVERDHWHLPVTPDGTIVVDSVSLSDHQWHTAFTASLGRGRPKRKRTLPSDRPARLLRVWPDDPGRPSRTLSGRDLARHVTSPQAGPSSAKSRSNPRGNGALDGLVLMHGDQPAIGLWHDEFPLLTQLADALDLEEILQHPAPGQLTALQAARWYLPAGGRKFSTVTWGFDRLMRVCTHPDAGYEDDQPMQAVSGRDLCAQLARRNDFDGLAIGIGTVGDYQQEDIRFGPGVVRGIAAGVDPRIGAGPLPARTRAEMELWMEITGFPWKDREIVPVDDPPGAVQARSSMASGWRPYETSVSPPKRPAPTLGPVFTISQPDARPGDLGDGQTRILCAGLLAQYLYEKSSTHQSGWYVSKQERLKAARMASIAVELQKLLLPGQDRLPRSAILTTAGASFLRRRPEYSARGWIEQVLARNHRTATHWLPSLT